MQRDALRTRSQILDTTDRPFPHAVDADGFVLVSGERVLGAKGTPVRASSSCSTMCQRCGGSVSVPTQVFGRYEPALDRPMFWVGIGLSWPELCTIKCAACAAKVTS